MRPLKIFFPLPETLSTPANNNLGELGQLLALLLFSSLGGVYLFNFISKKIRSFIIDDDFIRNLISKTVKENLKTNWDLQFVYQFDDRSLPILMHNDEETRDQIVVISDSYYDDEKLKKGFEGYLQFNFTVIQKRIADLGYFDSIKDIKIFTRREVRYCQQFDFFRAVGGDDLTHYIYREYYRRYPPEENILDVDADAFALYGIDFDFNDIFARCIKDNNESGDTNERFLRNFGRKSQCY